MNDYKKICVVGVGKWGKNHVNTLFRLNSLYAIVESNLIVLKKYKKKYPSIKTYLKLENALDDKEIDAFIVSTPAETHYSISKKIIKKRYHLLVEKPITLKSNEAIELHELSLEYNVTLMVGHVLIFHPAFVKIKEMIDSGKLGKLQYLYSNRLNLGTIRTEENVFWSFAPHDVALFQFFTNSYPQEIFSKGIDLVNTGVEDSTITTFKYPNKIMGHIFVSWLHPFKEHRFIVIGSKGMVSYEDSLTNKPLIFHDKSIHWNKEKPEPKNGSSWFVDFDNELALDRQLKYFLSKLGEKVEFVDSKSAIDVIKIMEYATKNK